MKRALVVAAGFGITNALVAAVVLALVPRGSYAAGWFAYAPLADYKTQPTPVWERDWAIITVPVALIIFNFVLVVVTSRRRWLVR